jgi:iron complex outermembrane receptor protein
LIRTLTIGALILFSAPLFSQEKLLHDTLEVITISSADSRLDEGPSCPVSCMSLEEIVDQAAGVNLVHRGGYAAEITFRGLSSFQNSVVIDGMRIYGACTDKMDPVSSYVDKKNLAAMCTESNNEIGVHQLDLQLNKSGFNAVNPVTGSAHVTYGTNNSLLQSGFDVNMSGSRSWLKMNANYHKAGNYHDGEGTEVLYTQYTKYNAYASAGLDIQGHKLTGVVILDQAFDIGYAGLPMDVSSAKAIITKLEHEKRRGNTLLKHQVYYNSIAHVMDDTQREDVLMHMDMPGWSTTYGFSGVIKKASDNSLVELNYEAFSNTRRAEMTMYPEGQIAMYMETWPETNRSMAQISPMWKRYIKEGFAIKLAASASFGRDKMIEEFGIKQWEVFGYDVTQSKLTSTKSVALTFEHLIGPFTNQLVVKTGDRQPGLSERYGFYLYNSQDGFDYLGNPELENESYAHASYDWGLSKGKVTCTLGVHGYLFNNYIFGVRRDDYSAMTPGGNGVKEYRNVGHAHILGGDLSVVISGIKIPTSFKIEYREGQSAAIGNLPQMSPWKFSSNSSFGWKDFEFGMSNLYALDYDRVSAEFGEMQSDAYWLTDLYSSYKLPIGKVDLAMEVRCSNLFNQAYTTHLNWGGVFQPGRNISATLTATF